MEVKLCRNGWFMTPTSTLTANLSYSWTDLTSEICDINQTLDHALVPLGSIWPTQAPLFARAIEMVILFSTLILWSFVEPTSLYRLRLSERIYRWFSKRGENAVRQWSQKSQAFLLLPATRPFIWWADLKYATSAEPSFWDYQVSRTSDCGLS